MRANKVPLTQSIFTAVIREAFSTRYSAEFTGKALFQSKVYQEKVTFWGLSPSDVEAIFKCLDSSPHIFKVFLEQAEIFAGVDFYGKHGETILAFVKKKS